MSVFCYGGLVSAVCYGGLVSALCYGGFLSVVSVCCFCCLGYLQILLSLFLMRSFFCISPLSCYVYETIWCGDLFRWFLYYSQGCVMSYLSVPGVPRDVYVAVLWPVILLMFSICSSHNVE